MLQFSGLVCVDLGDGTSFLRIDTSVSCKTDAFAAFVILDLCLIFIYQGVPLVWLLLLYRQRHVLNPSSPVASLQSSSSSSLSFSSHSPRRAPRPSAAAPVAAVSLADGSIQRTLEARNANAECGYTQFLWRDYCPAWYYFEVLFMYMRILFIAVIPMCGIGFFSLSLQGEDVSTSEGLVSLRASFGVCLSLAALAFTREASPFVRDANNLLNTVAQWQILSTM